MNGSYYLNQVFNFSILFAALIGMLRYREMYPGYRPFVFICGLALTNELVSTVMMHTGYSNALSANIYVLGDGLLWLWLFKKWGAFRKHPRTLIFLGALLIAVWLTEYVLLHRIFIFSSWFRMVYSFCLVFLSINLINRLIVYEKGNLFRNAQFLICIGVLIFYTYKILVESFYLQNIDLSRSFFYHIYGIVVYVNLFVNILFAIAALWIPKRQKFTPPY